MTDYDNTNDVMAHKALVWYLLARVVALELMSRAQVHDDSKLLSPEKECFDKWTPVLKTTKFGSEEYKQALAEMGEGLHHHYENNSHHPEFHSNGVNGMNLLDVIEMVCDWKAVHKANDNGKEMNLDYLATRFGIGEQLLSIIKNTIVELDRLEKNHEQAARNKTGKANLQ